MTVRRGADEFDFPSDQRLDPGVLIVPVPLTTLVGRSRELENLRHLLENPAVRLITLTGPGGVGKTRIALAVAHDVRSFFTDGVVFTSLAEVDDHRLVLKEIANSLKLREVAGYQDLDYLSVALQRKRMLLILDNLEQVRQVAPDLTTLLAKCPDVQILVTSRVSLRVQGEFEFPVAPLQVPLRGGVVDGSAMSQVDSVALFCQRATAVRPGFEINAEVAPAVAEICRRLDGLPLAIELAAARINLLGPIALLERLSTDLDILSSGTSDAPERHRTLRNTIAWSYDLLQPEEQRFFQRMSVFAGGWTLEATEAIAAWDIELDALDGMTTLINHHLVQSIELPDGSLRFTMLDTIREFGGSLLYESGEEPRVRRLHFEYYVRVASESSRMIQGPRVVQAVDALEREHDNMRLALNWSILEYETESAMRLAVALHWFWWAQNNFREGREWLERVLALPGGSDLNRARTLSSAGSLILRNGDPDRARELLEESLRFFESVDNPDGVRYAFFHLGYVHSVNGEQAQAIEFFERSVARCIETGDEWGRSLVLCYLGYAIHQTGDFPVAMQKLNEALSIGHALGAEPRISSALSHKGFVAQASGDFQTAIACYREAFQLPWSRRDVANLAEFLINIASLLLISGQPERAARLFGAVDTAVAVSSYHIYGQRFHDYDRALERVRTALGADRFISLTNEGAGLDHEQIIAEVEAALSIDFSTTLNGAVGSEALVEETFGLTRREREILQLLARGMTSQEIANHLFISIHTVKRHVNNILAKLNVSSRASAVAFAYQHQLL